MNILVVHQFFLRPGQPGGTRFNDFARVWRASGHDVRVIASSVTYTSGTRLSESAFPWSSRPEEGFEVIRTWAAEHPRGQLWKRIVSMLGFGAGATLAATLRGPRPDVVIATSPTLAAFLPGMFAASWWGCPLVLEVRDLWPESLVSLGTFAEDSIVTRASYGFEEVAYDLADAVVTLTPGIRDRLVERGVVEPARVVTIPNGVLLDDFELPERAVARAELGWREDAFVALYSGAHGYANDLAQLVDTATELRGHPIEFVAIGDGPEKPGLVAESRRRGLDNLRWLDPVPHHELTTHFAAADVGMVFLRDTPVFRTVYPNKMFDYMAARLPVLLGVDGVAADIVAGAGAGLTVPPGRPHAFAGALLALREDDAWRRVMGANGRALVEREFDRASHARAYLTLLQALD